MANTTVQRYVETWIREEWLPKKFLLNFSRRSVDLESGGESSFGVVSSDGSIVGFVSTSNTRTKSGNFASGKKNKMLSDILYLHLAIASTKVILLTEADMSNLIKHEIAIGRLPQDLHVFFVDLPDELRKALEASKDRASAEVSPRLSSP